jgi:hypothetical protein
MRNNPEEHSSNLFRGGSLKSLVFSIFPSRFIVRGFVPKYLLQELGKNSTSA